MNMLAVDGIHGGYGEVDILHGANLSVAADEIVVIVGPNGAGKSTLMKAVFGLVAVRRGEVRFDGADITNAATATLVARGLAYVPQERNVFPTLTVTENLEMGAYLRRDDIGPDLERVWSVFPDLHARRKQPAGEMSGGQRQMVAIARALMSRPRLLLLDEPTAGLSPKYVDEIFARIADIRAGGTAVLMVEQNARRALHAADRGVVLVLGETRFADTGAALLANREVAAAFLGGARG
jgi:branched-chain amino acid transport system ATP-binding protein